MLRVLLDTSYLFDFMDRPGNFLDSERRILAAPGTGLYVSAVSIWEIRLKHNARHPSGAQKSRFSPENVLEALKDQNITFLPMTMLHVVRALKTPLGHKGPFDELLLIQA